MIRYINTPSESGSHCKEEIDSLEDYEEHYCCGQVECRQDCIVDEMTQKFECWTTHLRVNWRPRWVGGFRSGDGPRELSMGYVMK